MKTALIALAFIALAVFSMAADNVILLDAKGGDTTETVKIYSKCSSGITLNITKIQNLESGNCFPSANCNDAPNLPLIVCSTTGTDPPYEQVPLIEQTGKFRLTASCNGADCAEDEYYAYFHVSAPKKGSIVPDNGLLPATLVMAISVLILSYRKPER